MRNNTRSRITRLAFWARRLLLGVVVAAGVFIGSTVPASAAVTASFSSSSGVLSVVGDAGNNKIELGRDSAGNLLVNAGAVSVVGGTPTVANTTLIQAFGEDGDDTIFLNEAGGALPAADLFGGAGNDTLIGGSGSDELFGDSGNDTLLGKGGNDFLFGGTENDTLTGGTGDDQVFGEGGDDRMVWNPGEGTDLNEGGDGVDTVEVNGGDGAEQFTAAPNGTRVRFDRVSPAPFSLDIGTTEKLVLNANGGDDNFTASGNLASLIALTVDGGSGNDTLIGSNGADILIGGDGNDFIDGKQGNDVALLGAGDDVFQWDPGDGSDTVEGQAGNDTLQFNGANVSENMDVSASGSRVRLTRDVANITMDLNGIEAINAKTLGGADNLTVHDLSGTGVTNVAADLAGPGGGDDGAADNVVVNATNGDDAVNISGAGSGAQIAGLPALVSVSGAFAPSDRLTVNALDGNDVVSAAGLPADSAAITLDGGAGNDSLIGGNGADLLLGGDGEDILLGEPGNDTLDGGPGTDKLTGGAGADSFTCDAAGEVQDLSAEDSAQPACTASAPTPTPTTTTTTPTTTTTTPTTTTTTTTTTGSSTGGGLPSGFLGFKVTRVRGDLKSLRVTITSTAPVPIRISLAAVERHARYRKASMTLPAGGHITLTVPTPRRLRQLLRKQLHRKHKIVRHPKLTITNTITGGHRSITPRLTLRPTQTA